MMFTSPKTLTVKHFLICSRQVQIRCLFTVLAVIFSSIATEEAGAAPITLLNSGFDDTSLPSNNQFDFNGSYLGWSEVVPATGALNQVTNVGPINLPATDLGAEHQSATNVLYYQETPGNVRVDQTTNHSISVSDKSFTLSVWIGNDLDAGRFGGYSVSLYADDGSAKTLLKTLSGVDIADNELAQRSVVLTDDVDIDLAPFVGQLIGVGISSLGNTYVNGLGNEVPGIVLYDSLALEVVSVPEPASFVMLAIAVLGGGRRCIKDRRRLPAR